VTAIRPIDALLTRTQQRVLALLFVAEAERTLNELVRESGGGSGAIRREVERMAAAGLLRERRVGNQRRFSADRSSPFYPELAGLAAKAAPAPGRPARRTRPSAALIASRRAARNALARHGLSNPRVFGSVARGEDTDASDLDLLVDARPGTSLLDLVKAKHALEDLLRVPVDLVTLGDLPESFRAAVVAEALPL
jgi:hypothetical protein